MRFIVAAALVCVACHRAPSAPRDEPPLQIVGETSKLAEGDAFPKTSPFFDGKTVSVRMASGETLGLQLLFRGAVVVAAHVEDPRVIVDLSRIELVDVTSPSTSMYGESRGAGRYPDRLRALGSGDRSVSSVGPVLVELRVLPNTPAGDYPGYIRIGDASIPLRVHVEPVELDIASHPRVWAYYDRREIGDDATKCAAMFRAHGVMATPELTLDNADANRAATEGATYIPVLLPDDEAGVTTTVKGWIERLAVTNQIAFAIPVDEPHTAEAKAHVRQLATWARAAGAGQKFLYAVTDAPDPAYDDKVDLFISPLAVKYDAHLANRWTYNGKPPQAGSMILDTDGTALRTWGWIAWRWQVPVWYVWDALYWHDRHNHKHHHLDPMGGASMSNVASFDDGDDHGNLDGVLAWPANDSERATLGCEPSLRLKALRRGLFDRALLDKLASCGGDAESIAARVVPTALADAPGSGKPSWPSDEAAWEHARGELLDAIGKSCASQK